MPDFPELYAMANFFNAFLAENFGKTPLFSENGALSRIPDIISEKPGMLQGT